MPTEIQKRVRVLSVGCLSTTGMRLAKERGGGGIRRAYFRSQCLGTA